MTKFFIKHFGIYFLIISFNNNTLAEEYLTFPKVAFKYDWRGKVMDALGSVYFKCEITDEIKNKLADKLPDLIIAWENEAPKLFEPIFSCFNRGFSQKTRTAIINLSHSWSYGSKNFLILGLRVLIELEPLNQLEEGFIDDIFHELLHVWVDENIKIDSPLFIKYKNEHKDVKEHIHLMALQKMVYVKLNKLNLLNRIDTIYSNFCPPEYKRAWEIVNDIEGYEKVLEDIVENLN